MEEIKFSVCICVYDGDVASNFKEALDSLINQEAAPNEVVIVIDGPVSIDIVRVIDGYKVRLSQTQLSLQTYYIKDNVGHGEARRVALGIAKYPIVALMDADDISRPYRFRKQLQVFKDRNDISVVGGQILEIDHITLTPLFMRNVPEKNCDIKEYMRTRCPLNQMTVMFKKDDVNRVGGYRDFYHNEDYYLWVRMAIAGCKFYNIPDVLVDVRVDDNFYSRRGGLKYFFSECRLQKIMYKGGLIRLHTLTFNIVVRFFLQLVFPTSFRALIFKYFFRKEGV
ncbi:hypothetical protein LO80_08530 [Candidatus Francisella endociliophora]|uniref:Glycosyltransferase 2-like domain-containing protein n=1 Tax=Candidatus Francisella endociliophora TaxID=653937 RepID=A0A097ER09_9GAMM|nr:glycosyltransferase [Francisella sp. FSC1006]AIT10011.1 hypothetical protein LO80_08530 [Francisella sp. FSC1006]